MLFNLLSTDLLFGENETPTKLFVNWDNEVVRYITTDFDNTNHQYFQSTIHPSKLSDDQRVRVLEYCLSSFDKDEIVNYNDLFLHFEFIEEANIFKDYSLSEVWV